MIAKRIDRMGHSSFKRLAQYILDAQGRGKKVFAAWTANCADDVDIAVAEISATQALNTRSKANKTYHLSVSFPAGENPGLDQVRLIEERLIAAIGMDEHQRIVAVHQDTEHMHFHVALSKIHPETFNIIEPYYDKIKLQKACRELEQELGLTRLNPADDGPKKIPETPLDTHQAVQSFQSWIAQHLRPVIAGFLQTSDQEETLTWNDFHALLGDYGVTVRLRGSGLVFSHTTQRVAVKPSEIDRNFSKNALEKVLGKFEAPTEERAGPPKMFYQASGFARNPEYEKLYDQFKAERESAWKDREQLISDARMEHARSGVRLRAAYQDRRSALQGDAILSTRQKRSVSQSYLGSHRRDLELAREQLGKSVKKIRDDVPLLTWDQWLHARAETGDELSLRILRRKQKAPSKGSNILQGTGQEITLAPDLRKDLLKHGTLKLTTADQGVFLDKGALIHVLTTDEQTIETSIRYAIGKFGIDLKIEGSTEFVTNAEKILKDLAGINMDRNKNKDNPNTSLKKVMIEPRQRTQSPIKARKGPEL